MRAVVEGASVRCTDTRPEEFVSSEGIVPERHRAGEESQGKKMERVRKGNGA